MSESLIDQEPPEWSGLDCDCIHDVLVMAWEGLREFLFHR